MTFWETVERGEYVMIALAVLLIAVVCVWWIKYSNLGKQNKSYPDLLSRVRDHVMEGDLENAIQFCNSVTTPVAKIIGAGLRRIGKPMEEVFAAMQQKANVEKDLMTSGLPWFRAAAVIAPLLGLGGTLIGIIDRLRDLGEGGPTVDLSMLCAAISPTIVTTVAGIGVGIVSLLAYMFLEARIDHSRRLIDEASEEFAELLNEPS